MSVASTLFKSDNNLQIQDVFRVSQKSGKIVWTDCNYILG